VVWKNPSKIHVCKWGLLKAREREVQREHGGVQLESVCRESVFLLFRSFFMGRGEQGDSPAIINKWGWAWAVPSQVRVVPEPKHG
jgi:hypothetical protein